ncbi:hypothetical protein ThvES_00018120 [Thiovulum sp. ES]|nr:hypothetical protein ThvES_00018120 [Thiovulum sp. ES]
MKVIVEEWSESMARSEQDSKNEFKRKVANGEWNSKKEIESIPVEVLKFAFGDNWKEEKARMIKESL